MIPDFTDSGLLPPGIHKATWDEINEVFGWNEHRKRLLSGLYRAALALKKSGCTKLYIDGSFVTRKEYPNDYDACWEHQGVQRDLLDPVFSICDNGRAAQKAKFYGEFFPALCIESNSGRIFLDFFGFDKETCFPKGIVLLDLGDLL